MRVCAGPLGGRSVPWVFRFLIYLSAVGDLPLPAFRRAVGARDESRRVWASFVNLRRS